MTPEEKQRLEQIARRHASGGATWDDIDFLLSLVKEQEAGVGMADDLPYHIVEEMGLGMTFRSCTCGQLPCARLQPLRNALETIATSMRSACVEKVKAVAREMLQEFAAEYKPDGTSFSVMKREVVFAMQRRLLPELESLSIEKER